MELTRSRAQTLQETHSMRPKKRRGGGKDQKNAGRRQRDRGWERNPAAEEEEEFNQLFLFPPYLQDDVGPDRRREDGREGGLARGGAVEALHGDEGAGGGHFESEKVLFDKQRSDQERGVKGRGRSLWFFFVFFRPRPRLCSLSPRLFPLLDLALSATMRCAPCKCHYRERERKKKTSQWKPSSFQKRNEGTTISNISTGASTYPVDPSSYSTRKRKWPPKDPSRWPGRE